MPIREWKFRINDIIDAIEKVERYLRDLEFDDFSSNSMIIDAVIRNFEVIGEASSHVPKEILDKNPHIPWQQMRGMRNILIHEYFGVDASILWHTAKEYLPDLKNQLLKLL